MYNSDISFAKRKEILITEYIFLIQPLANRKAVRKKKNLMIKRRGDEEYLATGGSN
jgi:hypothetical protein